MLKIQWGGHIKNFKMKMLFVIILDNLTKTTKEMGMDCFSVLMDLNIMEVELLDILMEKELLIILMVRNMKVNLNLENTMDQVVLFTLMVLFTKEISLMEKSTAKEKLFIMILCTKVNMQMI